MTLPRALVFDLDGTLIDSRRDLASAVNLAREDFRLPPLPEADIVAMVGEGAAKLVARAVRELGTERLPEALRAFLDHYGRVLLDTTRPYPGIEVMLAGLAGRFPLAVVSNKPEAFSRRILEGLGLAGHFREVIGGDTLPVRKPDPGVLEELARRLALAPADFLLVGDSSVDAATARAAGCRFAFVTWGFASEAERRALAEEGGADLVAESPGQLATALGDG